MLARLASNNLFALPHVSSSEESSRCQSWSYAPVMLGLCLQTLHSCPDSVKRFHGVQTPHLLWRESLPTFMVRCVQTAAVEDVVNELVAASDPVNLMPQSPTPGPATPGVTITTGAPPLSAAYGSAAPASQQPMPPRVMAPGVTTGTPPSAADGSTAPASSQPMPPRVMAPGFGAPGISPPAVTTPGVSAPGGASPAILPGVLTPSVSSPPGAAPGAPSALSSAPSVMGQRPMGGPTPGMSSGKPDASSGDASSVSIRELMISALSHHRIHTPFYLHMR